MVCEGVGEVEKEIGGREVSYDYGNRRGKRRWGIRLVLVVGIEAGFWLIGCGYEGG